MDQKRIEFVERDQDEPPLVKPRMGNRQSRFIDDAVAVEQQIEIDGAGTGPVGLVAAQCLLDFPEDGEQTLGRELRFKLHDSVQEPAVSRMRAVLHRLGLVQQGHA